VRGGLVGDGADYPRESAVRKPIRFGVGLRRHGVRGCWALLLCLATGSADLRASTPRHHVALGWHCGMRTSRPWRSDRSAWLFFPLRSQAYLRRRRRRAYADRWHKDRRASAFPARCNMQHASRNTQHTPHVTCSTQRTVSASARKPIAGKCGPSESARSLLAVLHRWMRAAWRPSSQARSTDYAFISILGLVCYPSLSSNSSHGRSTDCRARGAGAMEGPAAAARGAEAAAAEGVRCG
jgi:hypothetical protein